MTPEERGAKAANECAHCDAGKLYLSDNFGETIAKHIREAISDEREACAKIADENNLAVVIAELIRARKS